MEVVGHCQVTYCFPESAFATFIGCKGCVFFGAAKVSRMGGITRGNRTPERAQIRGRGWGVSERKEPKKEKKNGEG